MHTMRNQNIHDDSTMHVFFKFNWLLVISYGESEETFHVKHVSFLLNSNPRSEVSYID